MENERRTPATLVLDSVSRSFGEINAVTRVSLQIQDGEFFSILGPSGCGKTTLLRMIAGFERPTSGRVFLRNREITKLTPQERNIAMVFQNYALFPHMTVEQNVAFGLQVKRLPADEVRRRVRRILETVRLGDKAGQNVTELSGGEQQRVAVARAIVVEPAILLFDEPLSNLDIALRTSTREEIRQIQQQTGITTLYVTHDQSEALGISDRIAIVNRGAVEQVGTPRDIYDYPASPFVASFLGSANLINGVMKGNSLHVDGRVFPVPVEVSKGIEGSVVAAIKPEHLLPASSSTPQSFSAVVEGVEYQGFTTALRLLAFNGVRLRSSFVTSGVTAVPSSGESIPIWIDWSRCTIFGQK
jgi:ABC-type Fe3+/spermidine/putrescine transport system ATPase subunit